MGQAGCQGAARPQRRSAASAGSRTARAGMGRWPSFSAVFQTLVRLRESSGGEVSTATSSCPRCAIAPSICAPADSSQKSATFSLRDDPPLAIFTGAGYWKWFFHPQSKPAFQLMWEYLLLYLEEIAQFKPVTLDLPVRSAATGSCSRQKSAKAISSMPGVSHLNTRRNRIVNGR